MTRGLPRGPSLRRVAQYGESLTLTNETVSVDSTDPWNDATTSTTTVTVNAFVERGTQANSRRNDRADKTDADATVRIPEDELGGFTIRDYEGDKTRITDNDGREYVVVQYHRTSNRVYECEVRRQ